MIDVMTSVRIRADAKAEWQKAKAKLEILYDRGGVDPEFVREMQIKVAERERFYRRVESICRQNGIPDENG